MDTLHCQCGRQLRVPAGDTSHAYVCPSCKGRIHIVSDGTVRQKLTSGSLCSPQSPNAPGELFVLAACSELVVGKSKDADLRLSNDSVSRRHCRLVSTGTGWRVEDTNSTNGLFINNHRVKAHDLVDGDVVRIGDVEFRYVHGTPNAQNHAPQTASPAAPKKSSLSFLDDSANLGATAGATIALAGSATTGPPPPPPADDDEFQFVADDNFESGPRASTSSGQRAPSACPTCHENVPAGAVICVACGTNLNTGIRLQTESDRGPLDDTENPGSIVAYLKDCLWSVALIVRFGNLIKFVVLGVAAVLAGIMLSLPMYGLMLVLFRLFAIVALLGWICSYLFEVVTSAASGDEDLPSLKIEDGVWDDGVVPFFRFIGMVALVHIPAIAYLLIAGVGWSAIVNGSDPVLEALLWLRSLLWPMAMLITAVGGLSCFTRPDLIFKTIAQTFFPYLTACGVTALALAAVDFTTSAAANNTTIFGGSTLATLSILLVLVIGCWIVAMRCIGLYYHHFKSRFAWSWG